MEKIAGNAMDKLANLCQIAFVCGERQLGNCLHFSTFPNGVICKHRTMSGVCRNPVATAEAIKAINKESV